MQAIDTIETHFSTRISSVASAIAHDAVTVQYHQTEGIVEAAQAQLDLVPAENTQETLSEQAYACGLRSQQTFENFVAGSSNQLAYVAAKSVGDESWKKITTRSLYMGEWG